MRNERILIADDDFDYADTLAFAIEVGDDGHSVVIASSKEEVEKILASGVKPTVVLQDVRFPRYEDCVTSMETIKKYAPKAVIISLSATDLGPGDYALLKTDGADKIIEFITNLQH